MNKFLTRLKWLLYCSIFNHTLIHHSKGYRKCVYCSKIIKIDKGNFPKAPGCRYI